MSDIDYRANIHFYCGIIAITKHFYVGINAVLLHFYCGIVAGDSHLYGGISRRGGRWRGWGGSGGG